MNPAQTIAVDIVAPDEVAPPPEQPTPKPPAPEIKLPTEQPEAAQKASAPPPSPSPTPSPPAPQPQAQQATAASPPAAQPAKPVAPPQPAAPTAAAITPQAQAAPPAPEPDLSVKYHVNFGLTPQSTSDFDAGATKAANIDAGDVAKFREQLRSCSTLPSGIEVADKLRIVLRAEFARDGRLVKPPFLIEASASTKGPALMRAAITALQACQPYTTLPTDRYDQWKVLDLAFTPQDFKGG